MSIVVKVHQVHINAFVKSLYFFVKITKYNTFYHDNHLFFIIVIITFDVLCTQTNKIHVFSSTMFLLNREKQQPA